MSRCLNCGVIAKHMYEVAAQPQSGESVGIVCYDCKELFGQNGSEGAECGFHEACTDSPEYVALVQRTETNDSGGIDIVTDQEPILCRGHVEELLDENR
ncbi:hypothetical protein OB905_00155 [Halobacteria archaeon AArc-dxtr1]|nr:hypothetical protein [Halobacteria archaeon AArc-dxtr1]